MSSPWSDPPPMEPGNPDTIQPCGLYAADEPAAQEHDMSFIMAFSDPHPIALVCSCGRKYEVKGP